MRARDLTCPALLFSIALASSALANPSAASVARRLLEGELTPVEAAKAWKGKKLKASKAAKLVQNLLPLQRGRRGDHEIELTDSSGRTTDARLSFPKRPNKAGKYRAVILLHGLGGDSKQAFALGRALAPPHAILIAPSAKKLPSSAPKEDLRTASFAGIPVLKRFKHWWSYAPDGFPMLALRHLLRHYPIDTDRVVLAGYSMGGFGTWNIGLRYHDRFAGLAPMAGGISREEFMLGRDEVVRGLLDNSRNVPLFFLHGDQDGVVPVKFDRWSRDDLQKRKARFVYEEIKGGKHVLTDFVAGNALRDKLTAWLRERRRDPHPKHVIHRALGTYHGGAYWVRIDALGGQSGRVEAKVVGKNRIAVTTEGVAKLTIFLDPKRIKVKKPVLILLNGKVAFQGPVRASLLTVAESFARTQDPQLVYERSVALTVKGVKVSTGKKPGWQDWLKGGKKKP